MENIFYAHHCGCGTNWHIIIMFNLEAYPNDFYIATTLYHSKFSNPYLNALCATELATSNNNKPPFHSDILGKADRNWKTEHGEWYSSPI